MTRGTTTGRGGATIAALLACTILAGSGAGAQQQRLSGPYMDEVTDRIPSYNLYGLPGLIDMPTAEMAPDATLGATLSHFGNSTRTTLSFQMLPRLIGTFRYSRLSDSNIPGNRDGDYYDRSFDLRFQLLKESYYLPSVAVGLQDFVGTGVYAGEYVVATKEILPGVRVTGGLGWGRLGTNNPIGMVGTRPNTVNGALDPEVIGTGGEANVDTFFRGDVAPFAGISWDVNDKFRVKLEYSSDDYTIEETRTTSFERESSVNVGLDYTFDNGTQVSLYHAYGTEFGAQLTFPINPRTSIVPGGNDTAPLPVRPRRPSRVADLGWTTDTARQDRIATGLNESLLDQGIRLEGMSLEPGRATVRIENLRYTAHSQAIGRTARTMTRAVPDSISEFVIITTVDGMPTSTVTVQRGDLERHEFDAAQTMYAKADIGDAAGGRLPPTFDDAYPRFNWRLRPYLEYSAFDPDEPIRTETGLRLSGSYVLAPGFELAGALAYALSGNLEESDDNGSELPAVRTSFPNYVEDGQARMESLTLGYYTRPAEDLYGRITAGYLERMYAGLSTELLWKPVDSRLGLGAELNYVRLRETDQGFGIRENVTPSGAFPELTGHVSAYYDLGYGLHTQLDVGRYLAGDYGATLSVEREFENGWRIGAFATKTDVSAEEFGEGSFDKGITITIPFNVLGGKATQRTRTETIRPITRDGGARVSVPGRLYDRVRDSHDPEIAKSWGRFWR
ncbi:YjbH domain-containing protein [Roseivivax sediminis]|uniref:Exopolysaccharide biosynthesis protein YbjH n=1 Tax=Roseivivax sediminis TaxID=936889 RepID=A0A1I1UDM1_9RHOB|nr:YjbH domain-containing protein [Roseivivax sediminis]SFD66873.1 Exopolysaccharide biosynthesis protein YbjH [Roseivivax sediminis]